MKLEVKGIGFKHCCTVVSDMENDTAIITKHHDLTANELGLVTSDLVSNY